MQAQIFLGKAAIFRLVYRVDLVVSLVVKVVECDDYEGTSNLLALSTPISFS